MTLRLQLWSDEVAMRTHDGKPLQHRCGRALDGSLTLDLVPKARYVLRVERVAREHFPPTAQALFEQGLLIEPWPDGEHVERVVVVNLADRLLRVHDGQALIELNT